MKGNKGKPSNKEFLKAHIATTWRRACEQFDRIKDREHRTHKITEMQGISPSLDADLKRIKNMCEEIDWHELHSATPVSFTGINECEND
jgi:hypothetical protein